MEPPKGLSEVRKSLKRITQGEVDETIVRLYDEFVIQHGPTFKDVFFIATQLEVAKKLGTNPSRVAAAIRPSSLYGFYGFAHYKEEVLVRHDRGQFWYADQFRHFMPKHNADQCWTDDEAWHNTHHLPVQDFEAVA